ncbi:hypothetical protein GBAR_LOCUS4580 [Geodia barretti]|uniref:Uncharacterized protein n=1 Tax=Geodia barretti TaxID=519541 RepID=A0AA35W3H0_GEOBA|nr:hypothetical protein GBAR_LOCUS4580 [Geodia barretti]
MYACMYVCILRWPKSFVLLVSTRTEGQANKPS